MIEKKSDILQSLFFIMSVIIGLYPFIAELKQEWKVAGTILFGLGIWSYLQFLFKEWVTEQVLESKRMSDITNNIKEGNQKIKEDIKYIKGWMDALNHFKENKKGDIDPITLIVIIIVVIIIILILQGKI